MQIQATVIEPTEPHQDPEIGSSWADDGNPPAARGRYGWIALLAVAAIAVGLLVVQVTVARFCVPGDGFLPDWLTLAGLDCPSRGTVWALAEDPPPAAVLGAMRCELRRPARAGVDHQVRGRLVSVDGRKLTSEVAMLDPEASVIAIAQAVLIAVDPTLFGGATTEGSA